MKGWKRFLFAVAMLLIVAAVSFAAGPEQAPAKYGAAEFGCAGGANVGFAAGRSRRAERRAERREWLFGGRVFGRAGC